LCCKSMTYRQLHRLLKEQGLEKCSEKTLVRYIAKLFPKPKEYSIHIDELIAKMGWFFTIFYHYLVDSNQPTFSSTI
jgi:hypothetical protein